MQRIPFVSFVLGGLTLASLGCDEDASESRRAEPAAAEPAAAEPAVAPEGPPNPLGLPDDLSTALRAEMLALEPAMAQLQSQIARGRGADAAQTATRIHDSFILKQELSPEQLEALVAAVPPEFLHRDRAFHQSAASLAHAAEAGDMAEAARLYGEMTTACVGCHADNAATRFPGLAGVHVPPPPELPGAEVEGDGEAHGHAH